MNKPMKLHNKRVKLNTNKILSDNKRTNELFIDFIKRNSNQTLIAIQDKKSPSFYTFKENDMWLLNEDDLIKVK